MKNFIKSLLGFSIGPILGALISFITIPITTYFITPDEFGKASMYTLFGALISVFLLCGLDQAYTREYHDSKNKENLLKTALLLPLLLSVLIFFVICFNLRGVSLLLFESEKYQLAALMFGLTIVFMTLERFILLSIRMKEKALEYSLVNVFVKLNILLITLLFIFFIRKDFLTVVYSTALGQMLGDLYLLIRYRKYINYKHFNFDKKLLISLIKFGFPIVVAASLSTLLNTLDRIFLRTWSDFNNIGIFTAALKISAILSILQVSFTSFWVPRAYRWYSQNKNMKYFEIVSQTVLFIMSMLFCIVLLFKDLIVVILSPDYENAKFIIGLLCLQVIMYTISETTTLGIVFSRKSHLNIYVSLLSIIPNILLNVILTPKLGSIGAAIATGVSYTFFFFSRSYFSNKYWIGFSLKVHIFITIGILLAALVNTQELKYVNYFNVVFLCLIIIVQIPTIKKLVCIYKGNY